MDHTEKSPYEIIKGNCSTGLCPPEAACKEVDRTTFTCICPHDFSVPINGNCYRAIVTDSKETKGRSIPNIIPPPTGGPLGGRSTVNKTASSTYPFIDGIIQGRSELTIPLLGALGVVFLVLFGLACACCFKASKSKGLKKQDKRKRNMTPVGLSRGLYEVKYTSNPQYSASLPELQTSSFHLPQLPRDLVQFENVIGEGCFGKVYKGKLRLEEKEERTVAIKVLKDTATPVAEADFMREVEIMASFQHPNILSLLGFVARDCGQSPCMVFEFMPYGDLTDVLRGNSKPLWKSDPSFPRLSRDSLLSIAMQIAQGMQYLAEQHFVHRDLACRNCLVGDNITVKIADFGMSRDVYTCDYYKIGGSRLMPVRWMSPESLTYGRFTLESDVWSFGVVLWEIYSLGKQPYFGHSNEEVVKLILRGDRLNPPEDCPPVIREMMQHCWKTEPKDRIDFVQIYERLVRMFNVEISTNLPRPPPFMVTTTIPEIPEVEVEYYLRPQHAAQPHEYLQPLPD